MKIPERQKEIDAFVREFFKEAEPNGKHQRETTSTAGNSKLTDAAVLKKMFCEAKRGAEFEAVYYADFERYHASASEAVASILWKLAFYTNCDPVQMERLIRGSGLASDKFDTRRGGGTWLQQEIEKAIENTSETYTPSQKKAKQKSAKEDNVGDDGDDVGITKRLADAIIDAGEHFAQDAGGKLYRFSGGAYRQFGERFVKARVKTLLEEWEETKKWSSHRAAEVAEYIRVDAPELWERPPLDEVNVLNGILNVYARQLRDHDPGYLSTVQLPVQYNPDARCPEWDKFVATTFPEDAPQLAYEIPADLMLPERSEQKSILLIGEGSNGKSTYLTAASVFVGSTNIVGLSLQKMESDRFSASRLVGKLANVCPDLPSTHLVGTSMFKAITGGDAVNAEYKYRDSFEFRPFARLVFSANQVPRSEDATHAFFRRWLVVPFDRTFEGREQIPRQELDARLSDPTELSGVLNKALEVLPGLRKNGFTESKSMREAWIEFRAMTDPVSVWLDKATVEHAEAIVAKSELHKAYNLYCDKQGKAGMGAKAFGQAIKRVRPNIDDAQRTVGGSRVWCWLGLGLASSEPDPPDQGPGTRYERDARDARDATNCFLNGVGVDNTDAKEDRRSEITNKENPVHRVHLVQGVDADLLHRVYQALEFGNAPKKALEHYRNGDQDLDSVVRSVMHYYARGKDDFGRWRPPVTEAINYVASQSDVGGRDAS